MSTNYTISIANHPAQKRHPFTGQLMVKDGVPVPMITDQKAIKLDKIIIGYVMLKTGKVCFIQPKERLGEEIVSEAEQLAAQATAEYGTETNEATESHFVPEKPESDEEFPIDEDEVTSEDEDEVTSEDGAEA